MISIDGDRSEHVMRLMMVNIWDNEGDGVEVSCWLNRLVRGYRVYTHHPRMHCTACSLVNVGINRPRVFARLLPALRTFSFPSFGPGPNLIRHWVIYSTHPVCVSFPLCWFCKDLFHKHTCCCRCGGVIIGWDWMGFAVSCGMVLCRLYY